MLVSSMAITSIAQTPEECTPIYDKLIANRKGPELEKFKIALAAGKEYLEKCSNLEGATDVKDYVTKQVPKLEVVVRDAELYNQFNAAVPAQKWDDAFASGRQLVGFYPDSLDIILVLASIGFDNATAAPPVDKFNGEAINYAKMALQKMNEGKVSDNFGAFVYTYKTKDCPDGKTNATGWMNYTIGKIMFDRMNQKKDSLPYLYKATQAGCETKDKIAEVYRTIGAWYIDEFKRLENDKNAKYAELQTLEKITPPDPKFPEVEKQYNDLVALQKGYMERVMDAYARAYKIANANIKTDAKYKEALLNNAKKFYGFRNGEANIGGFDAWLSGVTAKPFPDPTSAVAPVVETTPTTTGTPTAMTVSSESPANTAASTDTRPRTAPTTTTATTAKPAATTTPATTEATTTAKKAPAKKPAPKKKGTR